MHPEIVARLEPIIFAWLCCVGACVGSFLNVVVFRLPRRCLSVFRPSRSFCPRCRRQIRWYENIPIVSWLALRARCGGCRGPISWRYPAVETLTLLLFGWLAFRDLAGRIDRPEAWALYGVHLVFAIALGVGSLIDWDLRIIPDEINVPGIILAPLAVCALPGLLGERVPDLAGQAAWLWVHLEPACAWWGIEGLAAPLASLGRLPQHDPALYAHLQGLAAGVFGAAAGAGFIYGVGAVFSRMFGLNAMGFGDVKLIAWIGGFTGWQGVVATVLVACLSGSLGGILHKFWSGRSVVRGADLEPGHDPLSALALWLTGARGPAAPDEVVKRWPGTGLLARFGTGDPYLPFGPFLALGAFLAAFWPGLVPRALALWAAT